MVECARTEKHPDITPAVEQFVFVGEHGINRMSAPLCKSCSESEQPSETIAVFEVLDA